MTLDISQIFETNAAKDLDSGLFAAESYIAETFKEHLAGDLKQFGMEKIPNEGFIAGSYPANFYLTTFGLDYKANDIDWFIPSEAPALIDPSKEEHYNAIIARVIKSERIGTLNKVWIDKNGLSATTLLAGFDINLCHAVYDCQTQEFFISGHMVDFTKHGHMELTRLDGPLFSGARLLKKQHQLGVKCNLDKEFFLLSQALLAGMEQCPRKILEERNQLKIAKEKCGSVTDWVKPLMQYMPIQDMGDFYEIGTPNVLPSQDFLYATSITQLRHALKIARKKPWHQEIEI